MAPMATASIFSAKLRHTLPTITSPLMPAAQPANTESANTTANASEMCIKDSNIASDIRKNVDADNNEIALTVIPVKAGVVTEVK